MIQKLGRRIMKRRTLRENNYAPGALGLKKKSCVDQYNHQSYHENLRACQKTSSSGLVVCESLLFV
jgi:hypothetical protein